MSARRLGYLLAIAINLALLWLMNVSPGWAWLPFLMDGFAQVLGLFNLALLVGVVVNLICMVDDAPRVKRIGDAVSTAFSLVVLVRLVSVFPFAYSERWAWAETATLVALWAALAGTAIAMIVALVTLLLSGRVDH